MPTQDPLATVITIVAAGVVGAVPVVAHPDLPAAAVARLLERAAALPRSAGGRWLVVQTSGTSAHPRAVVRPVASWQAGSAAFTAAVGLSATDVIWAPGSPSSTLTLFALWHAVTTGVPVVGSGSWRSVPAAGPVLGEVTVVQCVSPLLVELLQARDAGLLPALRTVVVAGAPTPRQVRRQCRERGLRLVEYYGAGELSFVAIDDDGAGLCAFPGAELAIRDGVIWVRSPYVSHGYLDPQDPGPLRTDDPQGTDSTDSTDSTEDTAWCSVGDLGELSAGRLSVHGRPGETVSVGGHTVLTVDVERALAEVDGVVEVVCVGEPDGRLGERIVLAVQARPGSDPVPALRVAARQTLPRPARPARYVVLCELPRTTGGKVARAAVRELVTTGRRPAPPPPAGARP